MFGNLGKMMQLAGKLKTELPAMKERLANSTYQAEAGGGAVTATVNGKMQIVDLAFSADVVADGDGAMLADLVKAAVSAAQAQAAQAAAEAMRELTGGMDLPGMEGMLP